MPEPSYRLSGSIPLLKRCDRSAYIFESPRIFNGLEIPRDRDPGCSEDLLPDLGGATIGERFGKNRIHWLIL
jgi:hypothetical protein